MGLRRIAVIAPRCHELSYTAIVPIAEMFIFLL